MTARDTAPDRDGALPLLSVRQVNKHFPGVHALKDVSFTVRRGEVHAVIGENGAGKSTLMRILSGVHPPDSGSMERAGRPLHLRSAADAFAAGIAMVWQDTRLVPTLDVAWNIGLGHEPGGAVLADRRAMIAQAAELLARIGSAVDPLTPASALSRAERQQVEIARALSRGAEVLILDEPTSALTPAETDGLFALVRGLRAAGTSVVFISHRLPEVLEISDRVTVLKDGEAVATVDTAAATAQSLVAMMVGRPMGLDFPPRSADLGAEVLAADGVATADHPGQPLHFAVRAGEVVGFGGIQGSGQQAAARALFGIGRAGGVIRIDGHAARIAAPADAVAQGVIYVPADRRAESLFAVHGIRENVAVPNLHLWSPGGLIDGARERAVVAGQMQRLAVKAPGMETPVGALSGGNQQKVVFARWMLADARVVVFDEPTQGVDVGTRQEIYRLIRAVAGGGAAVIVISSDLPELIGLTDRILVFNGGAIVADLSSATATEQAVISAAVAGTPRAAPMAQATTRQRGTPGRWGAATGRYGPAMILGALMLVMIAVTAAQAPYFLTPRNFGSMAGQTVPLALAALGQMATILLGGIDLSVGPTISLVTGIASYLLAPDAGVPVAVGVAACLGAGLAVGCVNGVLTAVLRIPDLVATLATFTVVQGLALIVRPSPGGQIAPEVAAAITLRLWLVPVAFVAVLGLFLVAEVLLLRGRIGARLYAVGASVEAARAAGISAGRIRFGAYAFCGLMAALAGLVVAARIGSGDPQAGTTFTLASVTAVVIGGTSVFGGMGTAVGTLLGAILILLMQNILNQFQITAYWQYIWTGLLTLAAVGFHSASSATRRAEMRRAALQLVSWREGRGRTRDD